MRSSIQENSVETMLDLRCLPVSALLEEDYFETVPLIAFHPTPALSLPDEEDLYTSFEAAISGRARSISQQLERLATTRKSSRHASPLFPWFGRLWQAWRSTITLACLGLSLLLLGFDLMGLLVLSH